MQKKKENIKKKHYKSACFYAPQNGFSFLDQTNWHMHKSLKNDRKIANNSPQKQQNIPTFTSPKKNLKIKQNGAHQFPRSLKYENPQKNFYDTTCGSKVFSIFLQVEE
jgi:hypothetical protein